MEENSKVNFLDNLIEPTKDNKVKWNLCGDEKKTKLKQALFNNIYKNFEITKSSIRDTFELETKETNIFVTYIYVPTNYYKVICFVEKSTGDVVLHYRDTELNGLSAFYDLVKEKVAEEVVSSI